MPPYSHADFVPERSVGYLTKRVFHASLARLDPVFAGAGITHQQWSALVSIWLDRGLTCATLARDLGHDTGATTRIIDVLEQRGLVRRERDAADRRVVNLALTEDGLRIAEECRGRVIECWNGWLADWSRDDVERLIDYLQRLRGDIEASTVPCA